MVEGERDDGRQELSESLQRALCVQDSCIYGGRVGAQGGKANKRVWIDEAGGENSGNRLEMGEDLIRDGICKGLENGKGRWC